MTLLRRVTHHLAAQGVAHALIGAAALAFHGVSRSTFDQDLLAVDERILNPQFWVTLTPEARIDVRRGDGDDPLAGVVRIQRPGERDVDLIVGRHRWQHEALGRATARGGDDVSVVEAADLILLKLYAGGSQDRWDIEQLLALDQSGTTASTVETRIGSLPTYSRDLWAAMRAG